MAETRAEPEEQQQLRARIAELEREAEHLAETNKSLAAQRDSLLASEAVLRSFFDSPGVMQGIVEEVDGRILHVSCNSAAAEIFGVDRASISGKSAEEVGAPAEVARKWDDLCEQSRRSGKPVSMEYARPDADGRERCLLATASYLGTGHSGRPRFAYTCLDLTEHERAEEALRQSEERHRAILTTAMDGFCRLDLQGRLLEVNEAYCRMSGYRAEELLAMRITDLEALETASDTADRIEKIRAQGEDRFESQHRRKDGTILELEASVKYEPTDGGSLFVFVRDITAHKKAEEALRTSERRLREAQAVGHTGYLDWDVRTNEIVWSDETCRIYGFEPGEYTPTLESTAGLVPPEDREFVGRQLADALAGNSDYDVEHRVVRPDGQIIHVHARGKVTRATDGTPLRMMGTVVDITERKQSEEEKERLQLQLAQAQKMECIGRLAGGVAHDFNNLLTVINGYAAFLSDHLADRDPLRRYAFEIGEAGQRAATLTSQLLAFSRKQAIAPKPINLNAVIADAERMLHRLIGEDVELVSSLAPHLGPVMADPDQIHQVILNLAVNARDAMPNGGKFQITTAEIELDETAAANHADAAPGRHVLMTVTDDGTGMTEEVRRKIFEPFFTTKEQGRGTGLGLATVYGIVRQNGGWIDVHSEIGRGSTFRIYLPRIDTGSVAADEAKPVAATPSRGAETVLIVEDQQAVRRLARMILEAHGYHVLEAADGAEAQAVAGGHTGEIELLLTDVVMPGMDGFLLSDHLRDLRPNLRVLLMSGYAEDVITKRSGLGRGCAYIQKPFGPSELAAKVRFILDSPLC